MQGNLLWLKTLCFAANPKTIHTRGLSVHGVLKLEDSCFNMCAMAEKTREFETEFCPRLSYVLDAGNWRTAGL